MKEFKSPYDKEYQSFGGPDKNLCRAPASIDMHDYEFIRGIRPTMGTVNTTQCLLWHKLVQLLKANGITDITKKSEFESLVANLILVDGRRGSTPSGDGGQTVDGTHRRGTAGTGAEDTNAADGDANPPRGNGKKRKSAVKGK